MAANGEVAAYFVELFAERRQHPRDPVTDMTTYVLEARIDDEPISEEYLLSMMTTLLGNVFLPLSISSLTVNILNFRMVDC